MQVELKYTPRAHFTAFHRRSQRWAILVVHRRGGKTVATINDLISKAIHNTRPNPRYGYVAPLYNQAKQIAWQYLKDYSAPLNPKVSESGLFVEFPWNNARVTLFGADNPDAFRGLYFDGLALDEYGNMLPSVWTTVLLPTLIDRRGWVVFMGTPNGPNHFFRLFDTHKDDPDWYVSHLPYTQTDVLSQDDINQILKMMPDEDEFAQEFLCSFTASTRGAIWAKLIEAGEREGRVTDLEADTTQALHTVLDLGWNDDTAGWHWQAAPDGFRVLQSFSNNHQTIDYYIDRINGVCSHMGLARGEVWLPHDAMAKTLQTGMSIVEQFMARGIRPQVVPRLSIQDGIAAARKVIPATWFDKIGCVDGLRALKAYRRTYNEDLSVYRDAPVHDWASHYADAFRYFALVARRRIIEAQPEPERQGWTLEELWTNGRYQVYH